MATSFLKNIAGNVAMMTGLAVTPMVLAAGAVMDYAKYSDALAVLQAATDAAAIAGAKSPNLSQSELQMMVDDFVRSNSDSGALHDVAEVIPDRNPASGTFSLKVRGKMKTDFMYLGGVAELDVNAKAEVDLGSRALELVLVLDNTGSMAGAKLSNLKSAAKQLVETLDQEKSDYATLKVAVVPFSEYVNVRPGNSGTAWVEGAAAIPNWEGCVGSRPNPDDEASGYSNLNRFPAVSHSTCTQPILPLTSDLGAVVSKIDSMTAEGNTYIPGGLLWGWNVITSEAPFTQGMNDAEMQQKRGRKVIVLMTDGANTISPTYPDHTGTNVAVANTKLGNICDEVKDDKVEMFTVSFMVSDPTIQNLLETCASSPSWSFDADNPAQLFAAFSEIGRSLASIRLTK